MDNKDNVQIIDDAYTDATYHVGMLRAYFSILAVSNNNADKMQQMVADYHTAMVSLHATLSAYIASDTIAIGIYCDDYIATLDNALIAMAKTVVELEDSAIDRVINEREVILCDAMVLTALRDCKKSLGCLCNSVKKMRDVYENVYDVIGKAGL